MISEPDIRRLAEIGIVVPARVDPELDALLLRILAAPQPVISKSAPVGMGGGDDGRAFGGPRVSLPMGSLTSTSLNWSGAVCASRGRRFRAAFGLVRIPPQPAPPPAPRQNRDYCCSIWTGMGGHRRWDNSLPQCGVKMGFRVGSSVPFLYAWHQWFLGTYADPYAAIDGFPLTWNDEVVLGIVVGPAATDATTLFLNLTQAYFHIGGLASPRAMNGVTAEWIVERPSPWEDLKNPYPLCPYGTVGFTHCLAYGDPATARTLRGARMVRMVDRKARPSGTRFISVPKRAPQSGILVNYQS
jgi:hypothetical protein